MALTVYIGNLPPDVTEEDLQDIFRQFGEVLGVRLVMDKGTGQSRRFGFIDMASNEEAEAAIDALNECEIEGFELTVFKASPREYKGGRGLH